MIETQLGWLSRDALIASSRNRLIIRASADSSSLRILTATVRPSAIWSARYTAPLPPMPMQAVSLNLSPSTRPTSFSDLLTWSWTWLLTLPRSPDPGGRRMHRLLGTSPRDRSTLTLPHRRTRSPPCARVFTARISRGCVGGGGSPPPPWPKTGAADRARSEERRVGEGWRARGEWCGWKTYMNMVYGCAV